MSANQHNPTACFHLLASVEPGVMPRILQLFAKRGLVPSRWHSSIAGRDNDELQIDLEVESLADDLAERIAAAMRQITQVSLVLTSRKQRDLRRA
ncbi:MAG: hypothetical protein ACTSX7_02750 [Alphaproteobacteria bacterium]